MKSQFIVILELVIVLNKGIYGKIIINVCCNLKKRLYLGTKKNKKGVILKDGGSTFYHCSLVEIIFEQTFIGSYYHYIRCI